ncbi:hypothetical protein VD659_08910 [Herbiconiux sp. 11R-BC]|uniref:hypothetical protein n=1 Tax=Herbiconiux sp. 11R-BC TaxID=3111637 RepID=UPI003C0D917B
MASALPLLLDSPSFPVAELSALVLDQEVRAVAGVHCPADIRPSPGLRALALLACVPAGLIAERRTAAWLHGALGRLESPLQLCVRSAHRVNVTPSPERRVRQVVLTEGEIVDHGGVLATDAVRTAVDLLRWEPRFGLEQAACVATLLLSVSAAPGDARAGLGRNPHLPHKQRALRRLERLPGFGSPSVELSRR